MCSTSFVRYFLFLALWNTVFHAFVLIKTKHAVLNSHIRSVPGPLLCSGGVRALACVSRRRKSVRPAVKWKTFVRRVCSTWSTVSPWGEEEEKKLLALLPNLFSMEGGKYPESWTQLCFLGLPIQVRDTGLAVKEDIPRSDVNKEYYTQNMEREVQLTYIPIYQLKLFFFLTQVFAYN